MERKARKDGPGSRAWAKGDQPKILRDAAKGREEASRVSAARLPEARQQAAEAETEIVQVLIEVLQQIRMGIPTTCPPLAKTALPLDRLSCG